MKYHGLFSENEAQGNIAMSCVKYLVCGINLIDPGYSQAEKRLEVAKGYHGLCLYASKHFIDHLLAYLDLGQEGVQPEFRNSLLRAADGLAASFQQFAPQKKPVVANDKLNKRCEFLKTQPALFALVASELVILSRINTRPRKDAPGVCRPQNEASR